MPFANQVAGHPGVTQDPSGSFIMKVIIPILHLDCPAPGTARDARYRCQGSPRSPPYLAR